MTSIRIWSGDAIELAGAADLYARTFAEDPYGEDAEASRVSFIERVQRYAAEKPHARLQIAWEGTDAVGLALGAGISAGDWWRDRVVPLLDDEMRARWLRDECFCVMEVAVAPRHRRGGLASSLLNRLLAELPYPTAVLSRNADAEVAGRFYAAAGWYEIASGIRIGDSPALCVLARDLR